MTGRTTAIAQRALSPRRQLLWLAAFALAAALLRAAAAHAETQVSGDQVSARASEVARPSGGMTMKAVEARFGAPQERHPAVGKPPITRWDYPAFAVYFENERVIHAVVVPAS